MAEKSPKQSEIILYQREDGRTRLEVKLENESVWLTQAHMAELFQTTVPNINMHLRNIFAEGELKASATIKEFLIVRREGSRQVSRSVEHYNLDAIISVGYPSLTVKKIPKAVHARCEWRHDDYSLQVENLPKAPPKPGQQEMQLA